jgi:hypothetical protein
MYTCTEETMDTEDIRYVFKSYISIYFILSWSTVSTIILGSNYVLARMASTASPQSFLATGMERTQLWEHAYLYLSHTTTTIILYTITTTIFTTAISSTDSIVISNTTTNLTSCIASTATTHTAPKTIDSIHPTFDTHSITFPSNS